jgi:hypothetical protein
MVLGRINEVQLAICNLPKGIKWFMCSCVDAGMYVCTRKNELKNCLCKVCKLTRMFGNPFISTPT